MKKMLKSLAAVALVSVMAANACAQGGRPPGYSAPPAHTQRYHGYGGGYHNGDWVGALLFLGLLATLLNSADSPPSPPAYAPMPLPAETWIQKPAPAGVWYYCAAAGQYYPYVRECPEAWETVPAVPPR